jgi:transcriptional regulator with XRE-family HTH domain
MIVVNNPNPFGPYIRGERDTFGAYLEGWRRARDIGLREMAKKIGVTPTHLSRAERDDVMLSMQEVRLFAEVIGDVDEIMAQARKARGINEGEHNE